MQQNQRSDDELLANLSARGLLLRLDETRPPTMWRGATVTQLRFRNGVIRCKRQHVGRNHSGKCQLLAHFALLVSDGCRVYGDNSSRAVANEVLCIESKDMRHVVNIHRRHNTGIMDLDARDSEGNHQLTPLRIHRRRIRKNGKSRSTRRRRRSALSGANPNPFLSTGRVATFQNSTKFSSSKSASQR